MERIEEERSTTQPVTWADKLRSLNDRIKSARLTLNECRIAVQNQPGIDSEYNKYVGRLDIQLVVNSEELAKAPEEVQMLLREAGLSHEQTLRLGLMYNDVENDGRWDGRFTISILPEEVSDDKIGVRLSERNGQIEAPTTRQFDGVHQYVDGYFGRGADLYDTLNGLRRDAKPYYVDLVEGAANWMHDVIMVRVNAQPASIQQ